MLATTIIIGILSFVFLYTSRFIDGHDQLFIYDRLAIIFKVVSILLSLAFCILFVYFAPYTYIWIIVDSLYLNVFISAYVLW